MTVGIGDGRAGMACITVACIGMYVSICMHTLVVCSENALTAALTVSSSNPPNPKVASFRTTSLLLTFTHTFTYLCMCISLELLPPPCLLVLCGADVSASHCASAQPYHFEREGLGEGGGGRWRHEHAPGCENVGIRRPSPVRGFP